MGEWIWYACCQHVIPACPEMAIDLRDGHFRECSKSSHVVVWWLHCVMIWHQHGYAHDVAPAEMAMVEHDKHHWIDYLNRKSPFNKGPQLMLSRLGHVWWSTQLCNPNLHSLFSNPRSNLFMTLLLHLNIPLLHLPILIVSHTNPLPLLPLAPSESQGPKISIV